MWKYMCGICKRDLSNNEKCNCSEKIEITLSAKDNNFIAYENRVKCECGSDKFTLNGHINCNTSHIYIFACSTCNKTIKKESVKK